MGDWIENILSAWTGHRQFAEWLVQNTISDIVVDLGVDYGYSTFVFANILQNINPNSLVYGIDLFGGDPQTGIRYTYDSVINLMQSNNLSNMRVLQGEFSAISQSWTTPINILHIDGYHTYDAVRNDFHNWAKFVPDDGIVLFHDVSVQEFGVKDFFRELSGGYKLYFTHSYGLGIYTKNEDLYNKIITEFSNVYDFNTNPF